MINQQNEIYWMQYEQHNAGRYFVLLRNRTETKERIFESKEAMHRFFERTYRESGLITIAPNLAINPQMLWCFMAGTTGVQALMCDGVTLNSTIPFSDAPSENVKIIGMRIKSIVTAAKLPVRHWITVKDDSQFLMIRKNVIARVYQENASLLFEIRMLGSSFRSNWQNSMDAEERLKLVKKQMMTVA